MAANEPIHRPKVKLAGRHFHLPASRSLRVILGALFMIGGLLGFLPIVGFWMIPLGLLILSIDIALVRRHRRKLAVWWGRRRKPRTVAGS